MMMIELFFSRQFVIFVIMKLKSSVRPYSLVFISLTQRLKYLSYCINVHLKHAALISTKPSTVKTFQTGKRFNFKWNLRLNKGVFKSNVIWTKVVSIDYKVCYVVVLKVMLICWYRLFYHHLHATCNYHLHRNCKGRLAIECPKCLPADI